MLAEIIIDFIFTTIVHSIAVLGSLCWKKLFPKQFKNLANMAMCEEKKLLGRLGKQKYKPFTSLLSEDIFAVTYTYPLRFFLFGLIPLALLTSIVIIII